MPPSRPDHSVEEPTHVQCPYCGEHMEIYIEPDVHGVLVQDCEVCCQPWEVRVSASGGLRHVTVSRADGIE